MKKVIIFDLDGTLLDTLDDLRMSVNFALSKFGCQLRTREQVRKDIGNGVTMLIKRSVPQGFSQQNYDKCLSIFRKHYIANYNNYTHPYSGLYDIIKKLIDEGYIVTVATNKLISAAKDLLNIHYPSLFDYIQGDSLNIKKKPDPMMIDEIIKHYDVKREEVLYIGDTNVDEETALNAKVDYALVTYGYRTVEEIKKSCRCTTLLNSAKDIYRYIKSLS